MTESRFDLSVVVSTFQRPEHLKRCLASLSGQTLRAERFQIVIADDGSGDETEEMVEEFRRTSPISVTFCTQTDKGFRKAKAVNKALHKVLSPYVVLTDGDCIFPPDHLATHLDSSEHGVVRCGNSVYLDQSLSVQIDVQSIRSKEWLKKVPHRLPFRLKQAHYKAKFYEAIRHSTKPKLIGNNVGVWLDQLIAVNGYDQSFEGWGCEDDDLGLRLRKSGCRVRSLLGHTHAFHLWHPTHETKPTNWSEGPNVPRFQRPLLLSHCLNGMTEKSFWDLNVSVDLETDYRDVAHTLAQTFHAVDDCPTDLEIRFWPSGSANFSGSADCNILVGISFEDVPRKLRQQVGLFVKHEPNDAQSISDNILAQIQAGLAVTAGGTD